jgi:NADPH2:quinone reductase
MSVFHSYICEQTSTSAPQILQAQGKYQIKPPFPFTLGAEFAGKIASNSPIPKSCPFKPGDRVFGSAQGAFADQIAVKWNEIMPLPDNLTFDQGAGTSRPYWRCITIVSTQDENPGLYITWPTSYEALVGRAELKPGRADHPIHSAKLMVETT